MILIRTQEVDERLLDFSKDLERWSGLPCVFAIDERKAEIESPVGTQKVSLTQAACQSLGLHCPDDFAWRCGDYVLYLARKAHPGHDWYWLIESDVRMGGSDPGEFFRNFADCEFDLLASYMGAPDQNWPWLRSAESKDRSVQKCFFPVCRFSGQAIDHLLTVRQHHSKSWARRHFWPNDEAFVATTLMTENWSHADLNDVGEPVYSTHEFHFESVFDGDQDIPGEGVTRLFHPVLFSKALKAKRARLLERQKAPSLTDRILTKLDRKFGLSALAVTKNRASEWAPPLPAEKALK